MFIYILLECYVQSSEEERLKAVRRKGNENRETAASFKAGEESKLFKNGEPLYGHDGGEKLRSKETWTWLKEGNLKRETEALIIAAQDKAIQQIL